LYVKELLGHKELINTLIYTHLVDFSGEDSYSVKVALTIEEFTKLLEQGFEYVSDLDNRFFRIDDAKIDDRVDLD